MKNSKANYDIGFLSKAEQVLLKKLTTKTDYLEHIKQYTLNYYLAILPNLNGMNSDARILPPSTSEIEQIIKTNIDIIFENACPNCKKLPKTPLAKQCPYCFSTWKINNNNHYKRYLEKQIAAKKEEVEQYNRLKTYQIEWCIKNTTDKHILKVRAHSAPEAKLKAETKIINQFCSDSDNLLIKLTQCSFKWSLGHPFPVHSKTFFNQSFSDSEQVVVDNMKQEIKQNLLLNVTTLKGD